MRNDRLVALCHGRRPSQARLRTRGPRAPLHPPGAIGEVIVGKVLEDTLGQSMT